MGALIDLLVQRRLRPGTQWPLPSERAVYDQLALYIALRENDRDYLARYSGFDGERYRVDPLPELVSNAYAKLVFGQPPTVTTEDEGDQPRMDELLRLNRLASSLEREENTCSSEGEVWWRLVSNPRRFDAPVLEWFSRTSVVPLYLSNQLRAVAFVNELGRLDAQGQPIEPGDDASTVKVDGSAVVYRHFECHENGEVVNLLYAGDSNTLGERVPLARHPYTATFMDTWQHGLSARGLPDCAGLAGRIINQEVSDPTLGRSDYHGIEDYFLELNDCLSTGARNRDLTALKRIIAPPEALDETGNLPRHAQVVSAASIDKQWGEKDKGAASAFGTLELSFDAASLIAWQDHVAATALSRKGITPQFVGMPAGAEGYAATGTALRLRLLPSLAEGSRREREWLDKLDGILGLAQRLDALQDEQAFSTTWGNAEAPPNVEMGTQLPEDPQELETRLATAVTARTMSRRSAIEARHPEWDDEQVQEELDAIGSDNASDSASLLGGRPDGAGATGPGTPQDGALGDTTGGTADQPAGQA